MRRLKPTQYSSGPNLTDSAMAAPFLPRRTRLAPLVARTVVALTRPPALRKPVHSLISNYNLYNVHDMRLNNKKVGKQTNTQPREEVHENSLRRQRGGDRRPDQRPGARPGKELRTQAFALGAGLASAAKGAGRLGRRGRESIRRHAALQSLSGAAARQSLRPLRHGARRHRRPHLYQSRLSARPLPDPRRRRIAVLDFGHQGRLGRTRRLV